MLNKLTFRNMKRSIKDYMIYIVTMTLVSSLMFAFNGMMFSKDMHELYTEMTVFIAFVLLASFFIIVIVIWLVHYMVNFMMEKRSKEFGTYLLLGMKKKEIASIFRRENILLGFLSLAAGFLPGCLFQIAFTNIFYSILNVEFRISPSFSIWNLVTTISMVLFSYIIALLRLRKKFKKITINKLIYMEKQNEKNSNEKRTWKKIFVFLSIGYMIFFNVFALNGKMTIVTVWFYVCGLIASIYLLYVGLSSFFVSYIKKEKKGIYKEANIFIFRQLSSKIKTMRFTMGTMTILFVATLFSWMIVMMFTDFQKNEMERNLILDIMIFSENPQDDFEKELAEISKDAPLKEYFSYQIYHNNTNVINEYLYQNVDGTFRGDRQGSYFGFDTYVGISDYNRIRQMAGYETVQLEEGHYLIQCKERVLPHLEELASQNLIGDNELAYQTSIADPFWQNGMNGADYLIIVPDQQLESMEAYFSVFGGNLEGNAPEDLKERLLEQRDIGRYEEVILQDIYYGYGSDNGISMGDVIMVKENDILEIGFILASMSFVMGYIGFVFFCIALTILAIQQLSDSAKYRFRYRILKHLGQSRKEVDQIVLKQLGIYYLCPYIISVFLSMFIGMFASERFVYYTGIQAGIFQYYLLSVLVFTVLYLVYFIVTYVGFSRNIHGKNL